jgi:NAD-dependent dihydropyrimidine dehydrogenase PreA subunit
MERALMAYVITDACIDVKDRSCVACCPVDCIYEGMRTLYIQPEECINCGLCVTVCPVDAIYDETTVPVQQRGFIAINAEFFGPGVSGIGAPGGPDGKVYPFDHPLVAALPLRARGS